VNGLLYVTRGRLAGEEVDHLEAQAPSWRSEDPDRSGECEPRCHEPESRRQWAPQPAVRLQRDLGEQVGLAHL
jgi:hypothetical protein